jgi:citrate synthase
LSAAEERPTPLGGPGTLSVTDERTGKTYKLKLDDHGHLKANDLKQITAGGDGVGLRTYDPG